MKALEVLESFGVVSSLPPASTPSRPPTSPPIQKSVPQSQLSTFAVAPARATKERRRGQVASTGQVASKDAVPHEGDL